MTYSTSRSLSIAALISPVKAPEDSCDMFCAERETAGFGVIFSDAFARETKDGAITISMSVASLKVLRKESRNVSVSDGVTFIFQLAAMMFLRLILVAV